MFLWTLLLKTKKEHDSIWMIIDQLTKLAHFMPTRRMDPLDSLVELYFKEITS